MPPLNTTTSIVDKLKSLGQDSSFSARAKLAAEKGILNYTGSAAQNTELLSMVEPGVYKAPSGSGYVDSKGLSLAGYNPVMQTTSAQTRNDNTLIQKADAVTGQQGAQGQNTQVTSGQANTVVSTPGQGTSGSQQTFTAPDGTTVVSLKPQTGAFSYKTPATLEAGQKIGYGSDGKRYIINKDGTTQNDVFADQEYETNKAYIAKEAQREREWADIQARADASHAALLEATKQQYAVRRQKMEDINRRYLGLQTEVGFEGNQARFMADVNNGVLADNETKGQLRLSEIDAEEKMLIAQIQQAKTSKDFEALSKRMADLDALGKEKQNAIQTVYKAAIDFNKAIDEQEKELIAAEKLKFEQGTKSLETSAPALIQAYDALTTKVEKQNYVEEMAKRLGITPEMVLGAIEKQRSENANDASLNASRDRSNQPKSKKATTEVDEFGNEVSVTTTPEEKAAQTGKDDFFKIVDSMISEKYRFGDGVPVVTEKGYLTYKAFRDLADKAVEKGISREEFLKRYASKINRELLTATRSGYGLTDKEYNLVKSLTK